MRRALVLGGSGYVGAAVLAGLARQGVPTDFAWHENEARAAELAARFRCSAHRLDLRRADEAREFAARLRVTGSVPDVIVHLATHPDWRSLEDIDSQGWDDVFAVSVRGPFLLIRELSGELKERGGDLVFVTGMAPLRSVDAPPQAASAQAAVAGLARSLSRSLAPRVRANVICIGALDGGTAGRVGAAVAESQRRLSALGRSGNAEEIARGILWLALENRYVSGATLPMAGGL
ncbi:MAG: SDR family oxidoreductase [Deltaproteobacteria bacterium]|nr:SDR family oxidoreductase [Deltaproteobacteria bacterium]